MTLVTRLTLILTLLLPAAGVLFAQEAATEPAAETTTTAAAAATDTTATTTAAADEAAEPKSSYETRNQFGSLLRRHPTELSMILALDPGLLNNDAFLAGYPELTRFVAAHPEVRRSPRFYMEEFPVPGRGQHSMADDFLQGLFIFSIFAFIAFVLAWLVRTTIEQKRWNRLSRSQSEVHNKILDRFGTTAELLEYVRSPAGSKFLESAPIPLHEKPATASAPMTRIMWSIQLGVVVMAGALGLLLVSTRFDAETAQGFFAMGAIALCVGGGFIASAVVSLMLSRRLGLWQGGQPVSNEPGA